MASSAVHQSLDAVDALDTGFGGGPATAATVSLAATVLLVVARASPEWGDAVGVATQAAALRERAADLGDADATAYAAAAGALAGEGRERPLGELLREAADLPAAIAAVAADVAQLAALAARHGAPDRCADAAAAALLAEGAARAAAVLVEVNLGVTPDDKRIAAVQRDVARATAAREAATAHVD